MELNLVLTRLKKRATKFNIYDDEIQQLTDAINTHGIKAVRKEIKSLTANKTCPVIVHLPLANRYYFRHNVHKCFLDNEEIYITNFEQGNLWALNIEIAGRDSTKTNHYYKAGNITLIQGYPLSLWIAAGKECPDCGELYIDEQDRHTVCHTCRRKFEVRSYNHKVEDELGFEETSHTRFGIELEYEGIVKEQVFNNLRGHALPKSDGSIRSGLEVVTKPACIATHKKALAPFFTNVKTKKAPNTGMHVHIERAKLSEYQIGFIQEFINHPDLLAKNQIVAGRNYSTNHFCKTAAHIKMTTGLQYNADYKTLKRTASEKYSALNTKKATTVELRIFSSPESAEECFAKLDFVSALVQYASPYSVHVKSLKDKFNWDEFTKFILANKKEFNDYHSYFIKGGRI